MPRWHCFEKSGWLTHYPQSSGRAIVFVAYDLGSLVVKKVPHLDYTCQYEADISQAISLASINGTVWPNVFSNTARFVCLPALHLFLLLPGLELADL